MSRTKPDFQKDIQKLMEDMNKVGELRNNILASIAQYGYSKDIEAIIKDSMDGNVKIQDTVNDLVEDASKSIILSDKDKEEIITVVVSAMRGFSSDQRISIMEYSQFKVDANKLIKVNYHKKDYPDLEELKVIKNGDFIDLRSAENVTMKSGDFKLISLGISVELPPGYYAEVVPRSSTFKNFGIIMSNSIGIIDESYCGDNDIWKFPAIAMRDTEIKVNDRIAQFRLVKKSGVVIKAVDKLGNDDRGGIGSTGTNEIKEKILAPEGSEKDDPKSKFTIIK